MNRLILVIVVALSCVLCPAFASAGAKKVAVVVTGDVSSKEKDIVNSSVMARLSGNKDYVAFERNESFLKALVREQDYQLGGDVPDKEIRAVGERMGADYVLAINVVITDDRQCHMSARLIELESGQAIKTCNNQREFEGTDTLTAMANNVAYRLLSKKSK